MMSLRPFFVCLASSTLSPLVSHCSICIPFSFGLVVALPFSCCFVVVPMPTPQAVAHGGGWGCFRGPESGCRRRPDVISLLCIKTYNT